MDGKRQAAQRQVNRLAPRGRMMNTNDAGASPVEPPVRLAEDATERNMMDPYEAAEAAHKAHEGKGEHQLRAAITAALVADRKRTLSYWLCRLRQRVIWFGGWEEANCGGWHFRWKGERWRDPTPVSVFRVFTHYGWGWQLRLPTTILVKSPSGVYFSPDGTPRSSTLWLTKRPEYL